MNPNIIYEDGNLMVIEKPSGWIVNEASTTRGKDVLQSWLRENYNYETTENKKHRSGIVHRLDKETSGLIIIAKKIKVMEQLQEQFKDRKVKKKYKALLHGDVVQMEGAIVAPVGRLPWNRERFGVLPGGRSAETNFKVIAKYQNTSEKYTFIEFSPITGRTHQIRIHSKYIGHPIVSDNFYAGRKTARKDRKWCSRLFLHASKIQFKHPSKCKVVTFNSKLPDELRKTLDSLEKISTNK